MAKMEIPQVPAWAEANKPRIAEFLGILDRELADRPFAAGDRHSVADITGMIAIDFLKPAKLAVPDACANVRRWHAQLAARSSASA
jgi:glutathione S-transferase